MKLKFFLVLSFLLLMMLPIGNHQSYIPSLSEATVPDTDVHRTFVSASLSVAPAPAPTPTPASTPLPRFSPMVVPAHFTGAVKEPRRSRLDLSKWITSVYKRIVRLIAHTKPPASQSRPHPTRTTHLPTKVFVPIATAPPTPAYHSLDDAPAYDPLSSSIKLTVLWSTYRLVLVWVAMVCASVAYAFACLFSRDYSSAQIESVSVSEAPQPVFESIIEMYCTLGFPPVAGSETPYGSGNSTPQDDLLPATNESVGPTAITSSELVDAGVESTFDTNSASAERTLQTVTSSNSIGSGIGHRADDSLIASSSGTSPIAGSPEGFLAQFPPSGQVHSPQHQAWLQDLITRLQEMQRQGNHYGRVYDGHPELEETIPATPTSSGYIASAEHTPSPPPRSTSRRGAFPVTDIPDSTSFESGLGSIVEHIPNKSPIAPGLSTTVSQDLLYDQLASLVDSASELGDDSDREGEEVEDVPRPGDKPEMTTSLADDPADIPLPPSPYVESSSTIFGGIVSEIDELLSMWGKLWLLGRAMEDADGGGNGGGNGDDAKMEGVTSQWCSRDDSERLAP
ncbi:hypothetical protein RSOLAG22IIIB_07924 [Rhizoctonia solani]|uniref:Transmembrane protein n=1 Tax=Rhizoctonia solani TaxID=456999 RepID=A0A0K6FQA2_9AGAM|nr:hypothetical protein RSOLAG22IIIB_07924 [Rhizoctonia solani]